MGGALALALALALLPLHSVPQIVQREDSGVFSNVHALHTQGGRWHPLPLLAAKAPAIPGSNTTV